jgi:hypothetical protein
MGSFANPSGRDDAPEKPKAMNDSNRLTSTGLLMEVPISAEAGIDPEYRDFAY